MSAERRRIAVVATYEERPNIVPLVEALLGLPLGLAVLVVDDSSPDGTAEALVERFAGEARVRLRRRPRRLGYGSAMREGLLQAIGEDFETVVTLDADLSHDPASVPALVRAAESVGGVAIGSRHKDGMRIVNWSPLRRVLSTGANRYVRWILGLPARDCTSGFRAYVAPALRAADVATLHSEGYAFLVEILHRIHLAATPVVETPIVFVQRRAGASKLSWLVILESVLVPLRLRARRLKGARP